MSQLTLLAPSKTQNRGFLYFEDHFPQEDGADGTLHLFRCKKDGSDESVERYRLQVQRDYRGEAEAVLLEKTSEPECYEVTLVGPRAMCSCKWMNAEAARLRKDRTHKVVPCIHHDAVTDLLHSGRLSLPEPEWASDGEEADAVSHNLAGVK